MTNNDEWIRADQVYHLFDAYGKDREVGRRQLIAGLEAARIRAFAMDGRLERYFSGFQGGVRHKPVKDWEVDPEVWPYGGNGYRLLRLDEGSFSVKGGPHYTSVELTGLSFHRDELIRYVGLMGAGGLVIENAPQVTNAQLGKLPANASDADRRDEPAAHEVARLIRAGVKKADAIKQALPDDDSFAFADGTRERRIRAVFKMMYLDNGQPLPK